MATKRKTKTYRTQRLELRELRLSDWKAWNDTQIKRLPKQDEWDQGLLPARKLARESYRKNLLAQRKRFKKSEIYLWSIFIKKTGEFVGWIDISAINREPYSVANLGWYVINIYRGNGYAKEATLKLISFAFVDLGFHRLEASIDPRNTASIKTAKSCGLHYEGLKKFYLNNGDGWKDHVAYITTPELFYESAAGR